MPPAIAATVFVIGILGLFKLDRDKAVHTSLALWIPVIWIMINCSRPVSIWLQLKPLISSPDQYLDGSPLDALIWAMLVAAGLIVLVARGGRVGRVLLTNAPILLFFIYCAISITWSEYPFVAFKRGIKAIGDLVMVLIIITDFEPEAALKRVFARVGFVLIPLSVLFIKYYPDLGRSYNQWTWTPMFSGVTLGKNELGMICLIIGLASLWRFAGVYGDRNGAFRKRKLLAHGVILIMVIWLFWMANSMTSLSCFVMAGSLIVLTRTRRFSRPAVIHFLVAALIALSFCALFLDSGGNLVATVGRDATLTGRTAIWKVVLSFVENPLLGTGFESFWLGGRLVKIWDLTAKGLQEAHNGYIEVFLNLGWVGIILLFTVIATGYRNIISLFRRDPDAGRIRLALFVAGLLYSLTEVGFRMMAPVWISFLLATVAVPEGIWKVAPEEQFVGDPLDADPSLDEPSYITTDAKRLTTSS